MKSIRLLFFTLVSLPFLAQAESAGKAQIITQFNKASQCISPVRIRKIDGREATVHRMGFDLEPGRHTMSGSVLLDTSFCKTIGRVSNLDKAPPLEAEFEAGKKYWVGFDHSSSNRDEWKYVIWKVEDQ